VRLVTIILTTLNSERYLARSLESCLRQTYREIEVLVVDGGSQDRTLEILGGYSDSRIRRVRQIDVSGRLPGALNLGMAEAQGDYLTWTQDDCWYEPQAIQTLVEYLNAHPEVGLVYADYWEVDESGARTRYQSVNPPLPEIMLVDDVVRQCFLFRREVYETVGPQEVKYFPVHEVPWRLRAARRFKLQPLHRPLMYYTQHDHSLTGQIGSWQLQRICAAVLHQEGYLTAGDLRRRLAQIDVDQAYEYYVLRGDFGAFWRTLLPGLWRDPRRLLDRGLLKLMLRSALPGRSRFRAGLLRTWQAEDGRRQQAAIAQSEQPAS
jgi:glycosyltransferase involved in cell wall biosynthesis